MHDIYDDFTVYFYLKLNEASEMQNTASSRRANKQTTKIRKRGTHRPLETKIPIARRMKRE